jgi:hypothetical protein
MDLPTERMSRQLLRRLIAADHALAHVTGPDPYPLRAPHVVRWIVVWLALGLGLGAWLLG